MFCCFRKWGVSEHDEKFGYYMDFIRTLSNVSFETLENFQKFGKDESLKEIDMAELVTKV